LSTDIKRPYMDKNFAMPSIEEWLNSLEMNQYYDNFVRNGCISIEQVTQLNSR